MKLTNLIGFVAVGVVIPSTIVATSNSALGDVKVRTPNVEAVTRNDGSIYVNSGETTIQVPSRHRYWTPWRYWRLPWQNYTERHSNCRHSSSSYQSTTYETASSRQTIQSSISTNSCN